MGKLIEVNQENWQSEIVESTVPVIVEFWATWCGPCVMMGPVLEEISEEFDGQAKIAKVNVDDNMELAQNNMIRSVPTLMFLKDGKAQDILVGAMNKSMLKARITSFLAAS